MWFIPCISEVIFPHAFILWKYLFCYKVNIAVIHGEQKPSLTIGNLQKEIFLLVNLQNVFKQIPHHLV